MESEWSRGYEACERVNKHDTHFGFIIGAILAAYIVYTICMFTNVGCHLYFDPTDDCQEVWDMYPYLSETFDASHAVWAKLGLTDLKVEQFEYCMNHAPWGDYDG